MAETRIQWSQRVWNPSTGCDKVSPGCGLARPGSDDEQTGLTGGCYALAMAKRLKGMGQEKYQKDGDPKTSGPGFGLTIHPAMLDSPLRWRKPSQIFVNSMSDLFHDDVPDWFIARVFVTMARTPQHTYQLLTKRHARMRSLIGDALDGGWRLLEALQEEADAEALYAALWPLPNLHLGVSAEDQRFADIRIPALLVAEAAVRWVSAEPLIGPLNLRPYLAAGALSWVVVGGESGPGARPCDLGWVRRLVEDCHDFGVPVFVKQLGSVWARDWTVAGKSVAAHGDPKGGDPQFWPEGLRVREFPEPAAVLNG